MNQMGVWSRIESFNRGRDPERLMLKYRAMQNDIFAFLRGTAHLFYEDWPRDSLLNDAPLTWLCGDLHMENFGTYKGDNRLTYFDINDFDEAALGPCTWDLTRFVCSVLIGSETLGVEHSQALQLCEVFLNVYCKELYECKARWIERSTATGMIRDLLKNLKKRTRADLLRDRTVNCHGRQILNVDGSKVLAVSQEDREKVTDLINRFAMEQPKPEQFDVMDVGRRIAGTGSLGLERYVVLVRGKGEDHHILLDLKYQPGSSLTPYLNARQPEWRNEAERVVTLQHRSQAIAPAFLTPITDASRSYSLRELMPQQDRLHLRHWNGKLSRLQKVIFAMGELVAWQHIRTGGWQGSATADQWRVFGRENAWKQPLMDYALSYSRQIRLDWLSFKDDAGRYTGLETT